jgi:hypothetical protein
LALVLFEWPSTASHWRPIWQGAHSTVSQHAVVFSAQPVIGELQDIVGLWESHNSGDVATAAAKFGSLLLFTNVRGSR